MIKLFVTVGCLDFPENKLDNHCGLVATEPGLYALSILCLYCNESSAYPIRNIFFYLQHVNFYIGLPFACSGYAEVFHFLFLRYGGSIAALNCK